MTIILSKDFEFEAAQALPQFPAGHKCRNIHGHSFKVTISVRGPVDEAKAGFITITPRFRMRCGPSWSNSTTPT